MKTLFRSRSKPVRFFGVALSLTASLLVYGGLVMPAVVVAQPGPVVPALAPAVLGVTPAASSSVAVAQQPLVLQPPVPPNIVLMLDDSGSMNADYMPDNPAYTTSEAMINAGNNDVYYDPTVTYTPPPNADGTSHASQTDITAVPPNGFNDTPPSGSGLAGPYLPVDLTNYDGKYECDHNQHCGLKADGSLNGELNSVQFSASVVQSTTTATYDENVSSGSVCQYTFDNTPNTIGAYTFNNGNSTDGSGNCTFQYHPVNHYFRYSTGPATAPVVHYVASAKQGCGDYNGTTTPTCVTADTVGDGTNGAPAPGTNGAPAGGVTVGENIANWFAYYHTRILMAQSGLMTGMQDLPSGYRFGFASINAKGVNDIPASPTPYTFDDSTSGGGSATNKLAVVQPFGVGTDSTSQKAKFWTWVENISPWSNTPLRKALQGVGEYYRTDQPWTSMPGDPGYVDGGTNSPLACRASYTILTTDGFWNGDDPSVGNADGTDGPSYTGPNGETLKYPGYVAKSPYSDSNTNTLADVAMYYWDHDLQDGSVLPDGTTNFDLVNEVPTSIDDPAEWQHMVTFTMGLGVTPTGITPAGTTVDQIFNWANDNVAPPSDFGWPKPSSNSSNNIADLAHAGVNGHGAFFSVKSPQAFAAGIAAALKRVSERDGTGASLAANSTELNTGTVIYQAKYYTGSWTGELLAYSVNSVTGAIAGTEGWTASIPSDISNRKIQTWNGSGFVPFQYVSAGGAQNLSSAQLAALGSDATTQENIINYLRGDQSLEQPPTGAGGYRDRYTPSLNRNNVLGDIVDSQPVFSGPPKPDEFVGQNFYGTTSDSSGNIPFYQWAVGATVSSEFVPSAASTRTPLIFVAANDGMLHAFDAPDPVCTTDTVTSQVTCTFPADAGTEVYAYLPGAVITAGLKNLADPAYGGSADPHQFYNDGQLTIADAYLPSLPQINGSSWHTILVGTTGRGLAKAVYALDITDPTSITPLWERSAGDNNTDGNSKYIGQMVGKPIIAQTNYTPASGSTAASSTWSVLIGNGYNSQAGVAALLQFNLATGALNVHTTTDTTTGNGLAAPVAWMDTPSNGVSDIAYAGDLHGQVWSFKLNDTTGSNATPSSTGTLLFTAKDASGNVQPITAGMLAGKNGKTQDVWLFFGTGQYLSSADLSTTSTQTWYGIIVQSATSALVSNLATGRSALVQRTITAQTTGSGSSLSARTVSTQVVSSNGSTDMQGKSGWYMDLLAPVGANNAPVSQGERMVDPNEFQGSLLIGVTRIPLVTDVCNPSGSGWIMALDPFTGAAPSNDFFDVNNDGYINSGDQVNGGHVAGLGFSSIPNAPIFVGGVMEVSFDNGKTASRKTAGTVGVFQRVSWRELVSP